MLFVELILIGRKEKDEILEKRLSREFYSYFMEIQVVIKTVIFKLEWKMFMM